jgi:hypothetical protein
VVKTIFAAALKKDFRGFVFVGFAIGVKRIEGK